MDKNKSFEENAKLIKRKLEERLEFLQNEIIGTNGIATEDAHKELMKSTYQRIIYIEKLIQDYQLDDKLINPKIFLSFAGTEGEMILGKLRKQIRKLRTPDTGVSFKVQTGMMKDGRPEVMDHIKEKMRSCCIYVGILTKEFSIEILDDEGNNFAPGAWVLLEAGIAIGLGLQIILLVEKGIHKSYWFDQLGSWRHAIFSRDRSKNLENDQSCHLGLSMASRLILEHYERLRIEKSNSILK